MANAAIDENGVPTLIAALSTDGVTVTRVKANSSNHTLKVQNGTTGTDHGVAYAIRDENNHPVLLAVSSADGVTPVEVYVNSSGELLINSV
jgi:hypothetical protein